MKRTFFLILLFFCALFVKADVLGPYTMDSNVPPTPTGYARVVLPIGGADASVAVSITVCDESGQQYVLRTTFISSYPTEKKEDHELLKKFIEKDVTYASKFVKKVEEESAE